MNITKIKLKLKWNAGFVYLTLYYKSTSEVWEIPSDFISEAKIPIYTSKQEKVDNSVDG